MWRSKRPNQTLLAQESKGYAFRKRRAFILLSNSKKPGIHGKVHIHGNNGASVGVEPESGAMFIAGVSGITKAQFNNLWTIPREEQFPQAWITSDNQHFESIDTTFHYIPKQVE